MWKWAPKSFEPNEKVIQPKWTDTCEMEQHMIFHSHWKHWKIQWEDYERLFYVFETFKQNYALEIGNHESFFSWK